MSFLYPSFLFGLLAVAIPVIIHLFNFQKPKKILFTNVKYLRQVNEITNNRLKLKHLLVLFCRILFIAFLVLAFAQPFLRGKQATAMAGLSQVFFYLDNSLSMQNEISGQKALDASIESISRLVKLYPPNTQFNLLTNDFEAQDQFVINHEKVIERLTEIDYSSTYKSAAAVHNRMLNIASKTPSSNKHFFFISDFQKSTLGNIKTVPYDSLTQYYFFPIQANDQANIYVDSVWLTNPVVHVKENNSIEAKLTNTGDKAVANLIVKLFIDDIQAGTASTSLAAGTSQNIQFNFNLAQSGNKKCRLVFEDAPVSFDNKYYFVLDVSPPVQILHLYAKASAYIKNVYANTETFNVKSYPSGNFDYSLIAASDLVVLDGLESISESLSKSLQQFLLRGGNLLIYPSAQAIVSSYNSLLGPNGLPPLIKLAADTSASRANVTLLPPDFNNPFFKDVFEGSDKSITMPFAFPSIIWSNRGERLLNYKSGSPYLSLFKTGNSKIYLAASPLSSTQTNFAQHATFVPVMYKIAFQAAKNNNALAHSFQEPSVSIDVPNQNANNIYTLSGESVKLIPEQRFAAGQLVFSFPEADYKPGFYSLSIRDSIVRFLGINLGRQESLMAFYTPVELKNIFEGKKNIHIYGEKSEESYTSFRSDNFGKPYWKQCLIVSLVFLLIEILLLRFFR